MTHRDDIEGLRQLHDAEEKKETWKDYAKLNKEIDKEMVQVRKYEHHNKTAGEHNLSLKMKYDLDKYFYNGEYEAGNFYMVRNLMFYYAIFMMVAIICSMGLNEL